MKKYISLLLSGMLAVSLCVPTAADEKISSDNKTYPASFDSRILSSADSVTNLGAEKLIESVREIWNETELVCNSEENETLDIYRRTYMLEACEALTSAEWLSMSDSSSSLGNPEDRIRTALQNGSTVMTEDGSCILGWDDNYTEFPLGDADDSEKNSEFSNNENSGEETEIRSASVISASADDEEVSDSVSEAEISESSEEADQLNQNEAENTESFEISSVSESEADISIEANSDTVTEESADSNAEGVLNQNADAGAWLIEKADGSVTYLYYDDESLASASLLIISIDKNENKTKHLSCAEGFGDGRIYPSDLSSGLSEQITSGGDDFVPAAAIVMQAAEAEELSQVTFYTEKENRYYDLQIFLDPKDTADPTSGKAVYDEPVTGKTTYAGYQVIDLPEKISLKKGQSFTVCLTFHNSDEAIFTSTDETVYDENGAVIRSSVSKTEEGVSYLQSEDGCWTDLGKVSNMTLRIGANVTAITEPEEEEKESQEESRESVLNQDASGILTNGSVYRIRCAAASSYVFDVAAGETNVGTNVQIYGANGTDAQEWIAVANEDGTYSFVSYKVGRALDVANNASSDGTNIQISTPRFADSQRFSLISAGDGSYYIRNTYSGKNIQIDGSFGPRSNVILASASGASSQKFVFEDVTASLTIGSYMLTSALSLSYTIGVAGESTASGANLELQSKTWKENQIFEIRRSSENGFYALKLKNSGNYITLYGAGVSGTNICQTSYTGSANQLWYIVQNDDGTVTFFSKVNRAVCLEAAGDSAVDGLNIRAAAFHALSRQYFYLTDSEKAPLNGAFTVRSAISTDRVLEVSGASTSSGANIQLYDSDGSAAQEFYFENVKSAGSDIYRITNVNSGLALAWSSLSSGGNVIQKTPSNGTDQYWKVSANSDGTYTISPYGNTGLSLDICYNSIDYGSNIEIYTSKNSNNQKWYLSGATISSCQLVTKNTVKITGTVSSYNGDDNTIYLVALNPVDKNYILADQTALSSVSASKSFTLTSGTLDLQKYLNYEFYAAYKVNGVYHIASNGYFITNPEKASSRSTSRTQTVNKKGGSSDWTDAILDDQINNLHMKNVSLNIPIVRVLLGNSQAFTYQGETYYFNGALSYYQNYVKKLNAAGVQINVILYADAYMGSAYPDYVTPTGRDGESYGATLVGMNAQTAAGRKKMEALFAYLADLFTQPDCHIDNWVIGNELDDPVHWNYCGYQPVQLDTYATYYSEIYRVAYNTIKSYWGEAEVYDSLDHVWNTTSRGSRYYTSMGFQDEFDAALNGEGAINWGLAFHPYCVPEQDPRAWQSNDAVTQSYDTAIISMQNIDQLTGYIDEVYGSSHHIILSETGISAQYNGVSMEDEQAACIAYCYYAAENNSRIDSITFHNYKDNPGEAGGGWVLGLYRSDGTKRKAYYVCANMDSRSNGLAYTETTKYQSVSSNGKALVTLVNGATSWSQIYPWLNISSFGDSRY